MVGDPPDDLRIGEQEFRLMDPLAETFHIFPFPRREGEYGRQILHGTPLGNIYREEFLS